MACGQHSSSVGLAVLAAMMFLVGCTPGEDEPAARKLKRLQGESDSVIASSQLLQDGHRALSDRLKVVEEEKLLLSQELDTLTALHRGRAREATMQEVQRSEDSRQAARNAVLEQRKSLKKQIASLEDSIRESETRLDLLSEAFDSLSLEEKFASRVEQQAGRDLRSGVSALDRTLDSLARDKRIAQQEVTLAQKRIAILRKKIEAYGEERELYVTQKNELMRRNASEVDLREIDLRIKEIDNIVGLEEGKLSIAKITIRKAQERIGAIDDAVEGLHVRIAREYDRKAVLEEFMGDETENLATERARLGADREHLQAQVRELTRKRRELETSLSNLGPEIPSLTEGERHTIEAQKALPDGVEPAEDSTQNGQSAEANRLQTEAPQMRQLKTTQPDTTAAGRLARLSKDGANKETTPATGETAPAEENEETSQGKPEAMDRTTESGSTFAFVLGIVLVLVLVGLAGLYVVGKAARIKKATS